jgi:hypothetical protein
MERDAHGVRLMEILTMRATAILLFLSLLAPEAVGEVKSRGHCTYVDKSVLNGLVDAKSLLDVDNKWAAITAPNAIEKIVYATRRVELSPGKRSDEIMIDAIPVDSLTFDLLYDLCYMNREGTNEALRVIAGGSWLQLALNAAVRRDHGYDRILMLPFVGSHNADVGEILPCIVSELQSRAPRAYQQALNRLPAEGRKYVCPDCC